MKSELKSLFDTVEIISFDIFDTLLLRPYANPSDLFVHLEKITGRSGFAKYRSIAETLFFQKNPAAREANFEGIYSVMDEFADMKQDELDLEYKVLAANPEMKEIYDYAVALGKKIIIASDMYLPLDFIEKVLHKNGFAKYDRLYISNAIDKRKDRGDMYDAIISNFGHNILHIGDNWHSDVVQAESRGLKSFLYPSVLYKFLKEDEQFAKFYKKNTLSIGASILTALAAQRPYHDDYWVNFGYRFASMLIFGYARWIYNIAVKSKIRKILFVKRDGYLIEKIFNTFNTANIETSCVYAPRMLNQTENSAYDPRFSPIPREICKYFKKNPGDKNPADFIKENLDEFAELYVLGKREAKYADYIKPIVENGSIIGIVDTNSRYLSSQQLIEKESGAKTHGFYWATFGGNPVLNQFHHNSYLNDEQTNDYLSGYLPDLIELIFCAPEDPVITMKDKKPVYQAEIPDAEKMRQSICKKIECGVLEFTKDIDMRFGGADIIITSQDSLNLIKCYVQNLTNRDIAELTVVKKSSYADNSVYVPLFPYLTNQN